MISAGGQADWRGSMRRMIVVAGLLPAACGCGGSATRGTGRLRGRVTHKGAPVREGTVSVYAPELGTGGSADLGAEGVFEIPERLRPGRYGVAVLPPSEPPPEDGAVASPAKNYGNLPLKYRDPQRSGLVIDVKRGDNTLDIDMTE